MMPEICHPIEERAQDLALVLFGCIDPDTRHDAAGIYLRPIYLDLTSRGGLRPDVANEHCAAIYDRAEAIEAMSQPTPAVSRDLHPGLDEFLAMGAERIAQMMR